MITPHTVVTGLVVTGGSGVALAAVRAARGGPVRSDVALPQRRAVEIGELLVNLRERSEALAAGLGRVRIVPVASAAVLVALVVGSAAPVLVVGGLFLGAALVRRSVARRVGRAFVRGLVPALDATVAALRGGLGLREALVGGCSAAGGVVGLEGRVLRRRLERGDTFEDALGWWAGRHPDEELTLVVAVLGLAHRLGGPTAEVLEQVIEVLRARRTLDDEVSAHAAQAVASAVLLAALPVVALALVALSDPTIPAWLLGTTGGVACLAAGGALEVAGVAWMVSVVGGVR